MHETMNEHFLSTRHYWHAGLFAHEMFAIRRSFVYRNMKVFVTTAGEFQSEHLILVDVSPSSGGSRDLERGVQPLAHKRTQKFWGCHAHFQYVNTFVTHVIIDLVASS